MTRMPATRTGSAIWEGTLKGGKGKMKLGSGAFEGPYSFASRFENASGTNPEELIGAAEAGCFSMALSFNLEKAILGTRFVDFVLGELVTAVARPILEAARVAFMGAYEAKITGARASCSPLVTQENSNVRAGRMPALQLKDVRNCRNNLKRT